MQYNVRIDPSGVRLQRYIADSPEFTGGMAPFGTGSIQRTACPIPGNDDLHSNSTDRVPGKMKIAACILHLHRCNADWRPCKTDWVACKMKKIARIMHLHRCKTDWRPCKTDWVARKMKRVARIMHLHQCNGDWRPCKTDWVACKMKNVTRKTIFR